MSDYRKRWAEVSRQFTDGLQAHVPIPLAEGVRRRIDEVGAARKSALEDIENALLSTSSDPIAGKVSEKCQAAMSAVVIPMAQLCNGLTKDDAATLEDWIEGSATADSRFFKSLDALGLGQARDAMMKLDADLAQLIDSLAKKWATMSEENKRIEQIEQSASAALNGVVQKALGSGTDAINQVGVYAQKVIQPFYDLPDQINDAIVRLAIAAGIPEETAKLIPKVSLIGKDTFALGKELGIPAKDLALALPFLARDVGMAASETIQKALGPEFEMLVAGVVLFFKNVVPTLVGDYRTQVGNFQAVLPNQGTILVSLSQTRAEVDAFLKVGGLDQLHTVFDNAMQAMEQWATAFGSDGLKGDANEFRDSVKRMFVGRYEITNNRFQDFVRANKGRFVGSIEQDTERELLSTDIWVDRTKGIAGMGMDQRLKEWAATTMTVTDQFTSASQSLRQKLIGLPIGVADVIVARADEILNNVRDQLKAACDTSNAALTSAAQSVTPEQITRDLDRSKLRERLYA